MKQALRAAFYANQLDQRLKELEKRYVDEDLKKSMEKVAILTKIVFEQQITFTFKF